MSQALSIKDLNGPETDFKPYSWFRPFNSCANRSHFISYSIIRLTNPRPGIQGTANTEPFSAPAFLPKPFYLITIITATTADML